MNSKLLRIMKLGREIGSESAKVILDVHPFAGTCDELKSEADSLAKEITKNSLILKEMGLTSSAEKKALREGISVGIDKTVRDSGCPAKRPLSGRNRRKARH